MEDRNKSVYYIIIAIEIVSCTIGGELFLKLSTMCIRKYNLLVHGPLGL